MVRRWGPWTEVKLDALASYLSAFCVASSRAKGTLYLDLFAGAPGNVSRETGRPIVGSVERALLAVPHFSRVVASELQPKAARELRNHVGERFPQRDVVVLQGDSNATIPAYLRSVDRGWRHAPTFAFVDQYSAEISWQTLEVLSRFRLGPRKVELWMYFGDSFIPRGGGTSAEDVADEGFARRVDRMFGDDHWRTIREARVRGEISGSDYRAELVNLMRWKLENQLGYATTMSLKVRNTHNQGLYTMIFATDADVGSRIMKSVFIGAQRDLDRMVQLAAYNRAEDRRLADGFVPLLDVAPHFEPREGNVVDPLDKPELPWGMN